MESVQDPAVQQRPAQMETHQKRSNYKWEGQETLLSVERKTPSRLSPFPSSVPPGTFTRYLIVSHLATSATPAALPSGPGTLLAWGTG